MIKKGFIKRNKSNLYIIIILAGIAAAIYFGLIKRGERVVHSIQADEVEVYICTAIQAGLRPIIPRNMSLMKRRSGDLLLYCIRRNYCPLRVTAFQMVLRPTMI